tara:strand:- start:1583 stop:1873 length:291 start_codon:yes stop_codon:yes gene_type:complete
MGFETNKERINKNGRPKGSKNKNTTAIRERFQELIEDNYEQLEKDLRAMRASERVKAIIDLAKFVLPTLKATEVDLTTSNNFQPITIEWKSEKELK